MSEQIRVRCRTNLDLNEKWPEFLPALPREGQLIQSAVDHNGFRLELEVESITWKYTPVDHMHRWTPVIELHIPRSLKSTKTMETMSIREFYEWYAPLVGKSVAAFIS